MKFLLTAALLMTSSLATAAPEQTTGIEMMMLNKNPQPGVGDRISLQEIQGEQCIYHGQVKGSVVEGHGLNVEINRKRCPDNTVRMVNFFVPLPVGLIEDGKILTGYPVKIQQNGAGS